MKIAVGGNQVNYELNGPPSAQVLMLSHALATNLTLWDPQMVVLLQDYRVLRYDTMGHGGTNAPPGPYTLDQLAEQAGGLLAALGIEGIHFLGISLGGMIGQMLALKMPRLLRSLVLSNTTSSIQEEAQPLWRERIRIAESEGMEPLVEPAIGRWFTPPFRAAHPEVLDRVRGMIRSTSPNGYSGCCHAIAALNLTERLHGIRMPVLVITSEEDLGTPPAMSHTIHEKIAGSELVTLRSASHLSNMEQPEAFTRTVTTFLKRIAG